MIQGYSGGRDPSQIITHRKWNRRRPQLECALGWIVTYDFFSENWVVGFCLLIYVSRNIILEFYLEFLVLQFSWCSGFFVTLKCNFPSENIRIKFEKKYVLGNSTPKGQKTLRNFSGKYLVNVSHSTAHCALHSAQYGESSLTKYFPEKRRR